MTVALRLAAPLQVTQVAVPLSFTESSIKHLTLRDSMRSYAEAPRVDKSFRSSGEVSTPASLMAVSMAAHEGVRQYMKYWFDAPVMQLCFSNTLLVYRKGDFLAEHNDHTFAAQRHVTSLVYLNDDYEGGEMVFPNHRYDAKPAKGTMLIFPARQDFPHAVRPVLNGTRMVVQAFWGIL